VAAVAIVVVEAAPSALLGIQAKFCIAFAAFSLTSHEKQKSDHRYTEAQKKGPEIPHSVLACD
jgi:hypothetical protein